jgi:hypothetical protein
LLLGYHTPQGQLVLQAGSAPVCPFRSWSACGSAFSPWLSRRCPWPSRHREVPASDHRWCLAGSIGCGPNWSSRSAM